MGGIANYNPKKDVPDLAGKVILITGGNVINTAACRLFAA